MKSVKIELIDISKSFTAKEFLFEGVSFSLGNGDVIGIAGSNGSGKSTLVKIIISLVKPDRGKVIWTDGGLEISKDTLQDYYGFSAPYLNLYEEFTPLEFIKILTGLRGISPSKEEIQKKLSFFLLSEHKNKPIRNFSSGMKQRMKLLCASLGNPSVLILDEPSSNLDLQGIEIVKSMIANHRDSGGCTIIATNEQYELDLCTKVVTIK